MTDRAQLAPAPRSRFALPREDRGALDPPERELALARVADLLARPTAPYFEDGPLAVVRRFAAERRGLRLREDRWGNLVLERGPAGPPRGSRGRGSTGRATGARGARRRLALSAHLDHPGLECLGKRAGETRAVLHGGVPASHLPGAAVRFFRPGESDACATARIARVVDPAARPPVVVLDHVRGRLGRGAFGTWDLTPGEMRGARLRARVCDDLVGAAAILATFDVLAARRSRAPLVGVFTRAEETGFVGCLGLLRAGVLGKDVDVVGLECSPRRPWARVGSGPVLRVGDAGTVFDPAISARLHATAAALREERPGFRFQRALMDGGRCESSAYNLWNVPAGGLCLALGNYHNCTPRGGIGPEFVDWHDYEALVAWLVAAAQGWGKRGPGANPRARLNRLWEAEYKRLATSAKRLGARGGRGR